MAVGFSLTQCVKGTVLHSPVMMKMNAVYGLWRCIERPDNHISQLHPLHRIKTLLCPKYRAVSMSQTFVSLFVFKLCLDADKARKHGMEDYISADPCSYDHATLFKTLQNLTLEYRLNDPYASLVSFLYPSNIKMVKKRAY